MLPGTLAFLEAPRRRAHEEPFPRMSSVYPSEDVKGNVSPRVNRLNGDVRVPSFPGIVRPFPRSEYWEICVPISRGVNGPVLPAEIETFPTVIGLGCVTLAPSLAERRPLPESPVG